MNIGIVGSEGKKFTPTTENAARDLIRSLLRTQVPSEIPAATRNVLVSGGCHLGGIDIWAVEEAKKMGFDGVDGIKEHLPQTRTWNGGYKERNELIAWDSQEVHCITLKELPPNYIAQGFKHYCYHCETNTHVKSGGCWTVKFARRIGKIGYVWVICADGALERFS